MSKDVQYRYALRKLSIGLTSVALGLAITPAVAHTAQADTELQTEETKKQPSDTAIGSSAAISETENVQQQDLKGNVPDNRKTVTNTETSQNVAQDQATTSAVQEQTIAQETPSVAQDQTVARDAVNATQTKTTEQAPASGAQDQMSNTAQTQNVSPKDPMQSVADQQDETTVAQVAPEPRAAAIQAEDPQVVETKKEIDPALIESVAGNLAAIGYNVFDIRKATEIWANIQLKSMYLADSFKKIHDQLPSFSRTLLEHANNLETADQRIKDNAAAIMLGMSYIDRWYNISYGDKELRPLMMFDPKSFGSELDSIDWLTNIGKLTYDELLPENNVTTFSQKLAPMLNIKTDLFTFLGDLRKKWSPELTDDAWFKANTGVHIVEVASKEVPKLDLHVYHRFTTGNDTFKSFVLPLLNIKNDNMYIVSTLGATVFGLYDPYIDRKYYKEPAVYREKVKQVHEELSRLATAWGDHFDFWYRITNEAGKERLIKSNIQVWDSYYALDSSQKDKRVWLSRYDTTSSPGMEEFFGPVGEKYDPTAIAAAAIGDIVRYYEAKIIDKWGGASIFSHEMTHHFDGGIYLDGFGRRSGVGVELFAEGLLQVPWTKTPGIYTLNTVLTFESDERTTNKGPTRFQTREDLQEYMQGLFDVTYLLDYAEAQAMVNKSVSEKQLMYAQISYNAAKKADIVSGPISEEVAAKLKTLDDFIDNNIIASRGYGAGEYGNNKYQQISMYAPDYAGIQSATSASGAITFRKTAFELLAAKGWGDGFVAYTSNKYANDAKKAKRPLSDAYKLEKIFNGEYNNDYATFKKAMFKERIDKRNNFKPLTITFNKKQIQLNSWDDLQRLMQTTVDQELVGRAKKQKPNLIDSLKAAVLAAEMKQTNDFRSSIFSAPTKQEDKGEILGEGTSYDLPTYDLNSLKKGEVVDTGTSYDLPTYNLDSLKKGEVVGTETSYDLPTYDLDALKKGEVVGMETSYDLPTYDLNSLKKGEIVGTGTSYDLPAYDLNSLKKGEVVDTGTSYDLPTYNLDTLKKGEVVGMGTSYDLPTYDLNSLKKGEVVGAGTSHDLPTYDLDTLKKGEVVGAGTSYDLPTYDLNSLKKGEVVGTGTSYDLPTYDLDALKKGEVVGTGTSYDLPTYDLDSLKKGEVVGTGTSYDLPAYDLNSLKKGEVVDTGTSYDLPTYNLDSLKKGEVVGMGTSYDLPTYDLDSLKKGEVVGTGTSYDLPTYDLDALKKGEVVGPGTSHDLPTYDLDALKKGEVVGAGTSYDLPTFDLDTLKKGEVVGTGTSHDLPTYDMDTLKKGEVVGPGTNHDLPTFNLDELKQSEVVDSGEKHSQPVSDLKSLKKDEPEGSSFKHELESKKSNTVLVDDTDSLHEVQQNNTRAGDPRIDFKANVREELNDDHELNSSSARTEESNTELPQTGDKNTFIESVLVALGTVSATLGLIVFRRKDKSKERETNK